MKVYLAVMEKLGKAIMWIGLLLILCMVCSTFLQVLMRYVAHISLAWTYDLSKYLFIWATMLGATILVYTSGHINVSLLVQRMPVTVGKIICLFADTCILISSVLILYTGYKFMMMNISNSSITLGISFAYPMSSLPISGVLMILFSIGNIMKHFAKWKEMEK